MKSVLLALPALALVLVACGDDPAERSEGRYCTEVGDHLAALNTPTLATPDDIDSMLGEWRTVAGAAPIAIQSEWNTMIAAVETAVTVDANDAASVQKVADTARASEPAANRVIDYTFTKCNATIGAVTPVVTVPVTVPATAPATPPPSTGG
ncbi:MAG: hypothetical protein HY828_04935 [Actinobacteria bacterium]|nr:hypothetical protein [Actinomycetota bacterium]